MEDSKGIQILQLVCGEKTFNLALGPHITFKIEQKGKIVQNYQLIFLHTDH